MRALTGKEVGQLMVSAYRERRRREEAGCYDWVCDLCRWRNSALDDRCRGPRMPCIDPPAPCEVPAPWKRQPEGV